MPVTNPASQVAAAIAIGLLIAFTCQLLLTNLGLAVGITLWGGRSWQGDRRDHETARETSSETARETSSETSSETASETANSLSVGQLSAAAGLGLLLTINGVLAVASYAAVRFCAPASRFSGAILGLVIWAAYLLVMTWITTRAANSLLAFIVSAAVSGLRQIFGALGGAMQSVFGDSDSDLPSGATALIRQETQETLETLDIPGMIEDYIDQRMPPQFRLEALSSQLDASLQQSDLARPQRQGLLSHVDLSTFVQWVNDELGLADEVGEAIADLLNQAWQRLIDGSSVAQPESGEGEAAGAAVHNAGAHTASVGSAIGDYLRHAAPWRLTAERLQQDIPPMLMDIAAAAGQVLPQLQALSPEAFAASLEQRGDLAPEQMAPLLEAMEAARQAAIGNLTASETPPEAGADVGRTEPPEEVATLQQRLEDYLHYTRLSRVTPAAITHKVETLVEDSSLSAAELHQASPELPTPPLVDVLSRRQGLDPQRQEQLVEQVQTAWQHHTAPEEAVPAEEAQEGAEPENTQQEGSRFWDEVTDYLRHSSPDQLSPEALRRNLEWLWQAGHRGGDALQRLQTEAVDAVSHLDWEGLKHTLAQRRDLTTDQVDAIWSALEAAVEALLHQAQQSRCKAQAALESWLGTVKQLLQEPAQLAFDPEQLKRALRQLLQRPDMAAVLQPSALLERLQPSEGLGTAIAQGAQEVFRQVLKAQGASEALLTHVAGLKDWIYGRVAGVEERLRERQAALQRAALGQLDATRKALAAAAWWLFAIAVTSATTAMGAGVAAVAGFGWRP